MKLYTVQIAQWRIPKKMGIPFLDTTFKTGDAVFAPTRKLVYAYKYSGLSEHLYREQYIKLMAQSFIENEARWLEVVKMETVAIGCYCPAFAFCHRRILIEMFIRVCSKYNIDFEYGGELTGYPHTGVCNGCK